LLHTLGHCSHDAPERNYGAAHIISASDWTSQNNNNNKYENENENEKKKKEREIPR
jgi:hypothetical protein